MADTAPPPVPGKRYRVIRDGLAQNATHVLLDAGAYVYVGADDVTVEELPDPLPTTARSLIEGHDEDVWRLFRGVDGPYWKCLTDPRPSAARHADSPPRHYGPFTVLFDAGAEQ